MEGKKKIEVELTDEEYAALWYALHGYAGECEQVAAECYEYGSSGDYTESFWRAMYIAIESVISKMLK